MVLGVELEISSSIYYWVTPPRRLLPFYNECYHEHDHSVDTMWWHSSKTPPHSHCIIWYILIFLQWMGKLQAHYDEHLWSFYHTQELHYQWHTLTIVLLSIHNLPLSLILFHVHHPIMYSGVFSCIGTHEYWIICLFSGSIKNGISQQYLLSVSFHHLPWHWQEPSSLGQ